MINKKRIDIRRASVLVCNMFFCIYVCTYLCNMYVCVYDITYSRIWINRVIRLPILFVVSWTGKWILPCPRTCLRVWSRETGSAVPSRVSLLISTLRLNLVLTYHGIPPDFRGGVHLFKPPYAIGSVPCLSGHAIAYRWRSLSSVCRHGSIVLKVVPATGAAIFQVTMDQLMCASLFPHPLLAFYQHAYFIPIVGGGKDRRTSSAGRPR